MPVMRGKIQREIETSLDDGLHRVFTPQVLMVDYTGFFTPQVLMMDYTGGFHTTSLDDGLHGGFSHHKS